jgi:hypothetical protein
MELPMCADTQPDITAWAAGAYGASPELTAAWLAVFEAGLKSGEMPGVKMKLVPIEPTPAMLAAAFSRMRLDPSCAPFSHRILLKGWDAMLAAAPDPTQERSRADVTGGTDV